MTEDQAELDRRRRRRTDLVWAVSYLVLVVALVGLAAYTRSVDQAAQRCIGRVVESNTLASQAKTEAADRRDNAELTMLEAMRHAVAAGDYLDRVAYATASLVLEDEIRRVLTIRQANPVPNYDRYCRDTAAATPPAPSTPAGADKAG